MVSDTRSARKLKKEETDDPNSKNKVNTRNDSSSVSSPVKPDTSGLRRSSRETASLFRQTTPSPQNSTRKSKRAEKEIPPLSTTPTTRKSERLEKHNTPSPLSKSDKGKKVSSSTSSGSRQSLRRLTPSELKSKKEKSLAQVTLEAQKVELSTKRKNTNAKTFKGLFKKQCIRKIMPDVDEELEGPDKLSCVSSDNTGERTANDNMDAPESESSACLARPRDGSISSESVIEATTSPSASQYRNLLGACALCSKHKRISYYSPVQELCSCNYTGDGDLGNVSASKDRGDHEAAVSDVCAVCDKAGELLSCVGAGCKRCYHLCCLDPPLTELLPGVWHCPQCVRKKLLFGVHSVSKGVESIWDVREVSVSDDKGVRQRQYFVKYDGLAHVHNLWVPEKQILLENPSIVSNYNAKDQTVRWTVEWTVPHRLLRRRPIQEKIFVASSDVISVCNYEWLVKWQGLDYDHATWELESVNFLSSSLGQNAMKDYEVRCEKAKQEVKKHDKGSIIKLSELPCGQSPGNDYSILENVNKLRECWFKCQNAVVFDNQEQAMSVIYSIGSMVESHGPFLIIAASSSLSQWEAEFARLVPSVGVVVYNGNGETRKVIRASEFYDEEGHVLLQVLLSSPEAAFEDLDILKSIKWEAVIIDGHQHSVISNDLEQIKMLSTESNILLVIGQIKDTTSEYVKILSLLEPHGDLQRIRGSKSETNDSLSKLKDRLSHFVAYGTISQVSKFIEYWVPVQISNYQLEQYCATLLSNSLLLGSCSRSDPVGALRETLHSVRKCCNHPYLLDPSVQERLIAELRPATEILDIGIKASGKLQLLDMMLTEIKTLGLQVLVLYQMIIGSKATSTGDILDDFLRQRFGPTTYERVDAGVLPSKKQAAANRFNKKENGQFVFLLENRGCSSVIKLSSVDIVIIYDSDWNPATDLRALQKMSLDSKAEQIKVFRLYSSCTVEERALVLAKKNLNLENNLQTLSRVTSDSLLTWGASYLFGKLEEYHADSNSASDFKFSSGESLSNEVIKEFQAAILSGSCENSYINSVISKVKLGVGSYSTNIPMLGEAKVQLKDGEEPRVFWRNLLDGKNPQWKYLREPCPRNRKRVHYVEGSPSKGEVTNDDVAKKRKKVVHENVDQVELGVHQGTQVAGSKEGTSAIKACSQSQSLQRDNTISNNIPNCMSGSTFTAEVSTSASEKRVVSSDEQKSLHNFVQGEITRLCQILKLSDDVTCIVTNFLEYVIKNHQVSGDSPAIVQAFQISLCWIAASILKQKIDKKDSLTLAKQLLNYQCTEEQACSVYSRMRPLKRLYLQSSENIISDEPTNINKDGLQLSSLKQQKEKMEIPEKSANEYKLALKDEAAESEICSMIKKMQKKCSKHIKKLMRKQLEEIQEFERIWDEKEKNLESDYKLESAVIRSLHVQGSQRMDKLKLLNDNFAKKIEEHNLLKDMKRKDLEAKQLASRHVEREKVNRRLAEVEARRSSVPSSVNAGDPQSSSCNDDLAPPIAAISTQAVTSGSDMVTVNSENNGEDNACKVPPPIPVERVSNEIRPAYPTEEFQIEVPPTVADEVTRLETSKESNKGHDNACIVPPIPVERVTNEIRPAYPNEEFQIEVPTTATDKVTRLETSKDSNKGHDNACMVPPIPVERVSNEIRPAYPNKEFQIEVPNTVADEVMRLETSNESNKGQDNTCMVPPIPVERVSNEIRPPYPNKEFQIEVPTTIADEVTRLEASMESNKGHDKGTVSNILVDNRDGPSEDTIRELPTPDQPMVHSEPTATLQDCCDLLPQQVQDNNFHQNLLSTELHEQDQASLEYPNTLQVEVPPPGLVANVVDPVPSNLEAPNVEVSTSSPNNLTIIPPQAVVTSTAELPNQAVRQLRIDVGQLNGANDPPAHPTPHQTTSWNPSPSSFPDPLQAELERIRKETEQLDKSRDDAVSKLKSDCEKEIEEIRKKYEARRHDTESEFRLKRNDLDKNQNKIIMNKILAEAFRSKCLDLRPSALAPPGVSSSFMQQLHQLSTPPPQTRFPPSLPHRQNSAPATTVQTMQQQQQQQLSRSHSTRLSPMAANQSVSGLPVQAVRDAADLFRSPSSRPPPFINTFTPTAPPNPTIPSRPPPLISAITPINPTRVTGEIRSAAPHLQPFRSTAISSSTHSPTSPSLLQSRPHSQPFSLPTPPLPPPRPLQQPPSTLTPPPSTNFVSLSRVEPQGRIIPPPSIPTPSSLELVTEMDRRAFMRENRPSSPLPEIFSNFRSLEPSDLETLGNVQQEEGNQTSNDVASDVVCLSDDD